MSAVVALLAPSAAAQPYEVYWTAPDGLALDDAPAAMLVDNINIISSGGQEYTGDVVVAGWRTTGPGTTEWVIVKYTAEVNAATGHPFTRWGPFTFTGATAGLARPRAMAIDGSGQWLYVVGEAPGPASGLDFVVMKRRLSNGAPDLAWAEQLPGDGAGVRRYNGPASGDDSARAVTTQGSYIYVTGPSRRQASGLDYATLKIDASTGTLAGWPDLPSPNNFGVGVRRFNGVGNGDDIPVDIAITSVEGSGPFLYVFGTTWGGSSQYNYGLIQYNADDGARNWVAHYNGTGNGNDIAADLDLAGTTAVVTGTSPRYTGPPGGGDGLMSLTDPPYEPALAADLDYVTLRYDANSPVWVWEARYNGPDNLGDSAAALDVTASEVLVVGTSTGATTGMDLKLVRYALSNGADLWGTDGAGRFSGAADDRGFDVVTTGNYHYVTGYTTDTGGVAHILTIAWDFFGAVSWSDAYAEAGAGHGVGRTIAIDADLNFPSPPNSKPKIIVSGELELPSHAYDLFTIKYSRDLQ